MTHGLQVGDVNFQHINMNLHTNDIFTETLGADKLRQFMSDLGLTIPDFPSLRGSTNRTLSETETSRSGHINRRNQRKVEHAGGVLRNKLHRVWYVNTPLRVYEHSMVKSNQYFCNINYVSQNHIR